jgi:hypothetical protein
MYVLLSGRAVERYCLWYVGLALTSNKLTSAHFFNGIPKLHESLSYHPRQSFRSWRSFISFRCPGSKCYQERFHGIPLQNMSTMIFSRC